MKKYWLLFFIAGAAAVLLLLAGPGARFGAWGYGTGFLLMRIAFFTGLAAAALAAVLLLIPATRQGRVPGLFVALAVGLATAWVPWSGYQKAMSLPFIHDITTDTVNPPEFVDVVPLRADAPNPPGYEGDEIASQQLEAYPDLRTLEFARPANEVFDDALATARGMGWEIVAAERDEGRIEASATTFWFGFIDDVVIRVMPAGTGSRLDIRSKSRVGRSDVGKNAERIRKFSSALNGRD